MDMNVTPHPMLNDPRQRALIALIQCGLPLVAEPYAEIARQVGMTEREVLRQIRMLLEQGVIKRLGVVVRHHELGYAANAMVVWDVADDRVREFGRRLGGLPYVRLCYRRPRRLPQWPYNLFTMIHGQNRERVLAHIDAMIIDAGMQDCAYEVLFSRRRFKQRGACYSHDEPRTGADADALAGVAG